MDREPSVFGRLGCNSGHALISHIDLSTKQYKTTRTTQGVQLLVSKKGSVLKTLARLAEVEVQDPEYYRIRKVPAIGYYIKENSLEAKQVSFDDLK